MINPESKCITYLCSLAKRHILDVSKYHFHRVPILHPGHPLGDEVADVAAGDDAGAMSGQTWQEGDL